MWTNVGVVVENDRIRSVDADAAPPSGAQVIDLRRFTGIPGMIDAHTHMTFYWDQTPGTTPWAQSDAAAIVGDGLSRPGERTQNARNWRHHRARSGSSEYADVAMRDLINRGAMIGPRMFVSGYGLSVTGQPAPAGFCSPRREAPPMAWPKCFAWCGSKWPPMST